MPPHASAGQGDPAHDRLRHMRNKTGYLLSSAAKHLSGAHRACPSCGAAPAEQLDQKWLVTTFCRSSKCRLLHRIPTSDPQENETFYQEDYTEGFTTDLPSATEIQHLIASRFADSEKNYVHYLAVLSALRISPGARSSSTTAAPGATAAISSPPQATRWTPLKFPAPAAYARTQLGVSIPALDTLLPASYDVFLSAHVIEHVPSPAAMIALGMRLLRPGGLFVCFCPNGSLPFRRRAPRDWHLMWGTQKHRFAAAHPFS